MKGLMQGRIRVLCLCLLLLALLAGWGVVGYPHDAAVPSGGSLEAPSLSHWLGTDDLGMDIFAQVSSGFFLSTSVGMAAAGLSFVLGGVLGVLAGWRPGRIDHIISFAVHVFLCVPQLPLMIVAGAFLGQSVWNVILILSAFSWAPIAKVVRERTRALRGTAYLVQAESYGGGVWYLLRVHMAGELMPLLAVESLAVAGKAIVQEASLAYLGLCDPLSKSWGLLIQKCISFKGIYFTAYWKWWLLPPVVALIATVLCVRLLSKELEKVWLA